VSDPKETSQGGDSEVPLNETTPKIDVQQRDTGGGSDSAPLDKTTPKIDSFLGSQNPSSRRH